jgi:hypothetical protein
MMRPMTLQRHRDRGRKLFAATMLSLSTLVTSPAGALAQDEDVAVDARLEGYTQKVTIEGSTALMWILLFVLATIALSVLFKDAKRSHLD